MLTKNSINQVSKFLNEQNLGDSQGDVVQIGYGASANQKREYEAIGDVSKKAN